MMRNPIWKCKTLLKTLIGVCQQSRNYSVNELVTLVRIKKQRRCQLHLQYSLVSLQITDSLKTILVKKILLQVDKKTNKMNKIVQVVGVNSDYARQTKTNFRQRKINFKQMKTNFRIVE